MNNAMNNAMATHSSAPAWWGKKKQEGHKFKSHAVSYITYLYNKTQIGKEER